MAATQNGGRSTSLAVQTLRFVCKHLAVLVMVPIAAVVTLQLQKLHEQGDLQKYYDLAATTTVPTNPVLLALMGLITVVAVAHSYFKKPSETVYLVDFAVHKSLDEWRFPLSWFIPASAKRGTQFTEDDLAFQEKILYRSGLGDETSVPPWLYSDPPHFDMVHARKEFEITCYSAVKDLLNKTGVKAKQIGIVITNCSLFNPTPSLSAQIMNHFEMGPGTLNYNLGGMGCSAGVVALDLARQMLQLYPDRYALVVSHENLTSNWYPGADRSMLVPNCIFRSNGAAVLLSNKKRDSRRSKYVLERVVRTTMATDVGFQCVFQCEDEKGIVGVRLGKELMNVAGTVLRQNLTTLGPMVLPLSEKLIFAGNLIARKIKGPKKVPAYVPDFAQAFNHICIHTGGRAVLDTMEKQLGLSKHMMEPSRAGLYRFGNVSSTSIWYVLAYIETFRGVKAGDKVWQLGFGSGFKCNSAVWRANRALPKGGHAAWEGFNRQSMLEEFAEAEAEKARYLAQKAAAAAKKH